MPHCLEPSNLLEPGPQSHSGQNLRLRPGTFCPVVNGNAFRRKTGSCGSKCRRFLPERCGKNCFFKGVVWLTFPSNRDMPGVRSKPPCYLELILATRSFRPID